MLLGHMNDRDHTHHCSALCWLAVFIMLLAPGGYGQRPCRDTLVYVYDSICEGDTYLFNDRELTYTGLFFDTLPRVAGECDSIIILRLTVLMIPEVHFYPYRRCEGNVGYDLYSSGIGTYYRWWSSPPDSTLLDQQNRSWVHVNPQVPTTYYLYNDYRESPQCPDSGSVQINPIVLCVGAMRLTPDEITLDHLDFTVEDFSVGTREYHYGGWGGRHWYINGVHQDENGEKATFHAEPWWPDTVEVMMQAFTPTCIDTVIKRLPFKKISLYFPNIFTPEGDGNSLFAPVLTGVIEFEMWIYNRYGTLIFHSFDANTPWDGTYDGRPCPSGSYVYRCRYSDIYTPDGFQSLEGCVTLLR